MPTVIIPFPLRKYVQDQREVIVEGESLREIMASLVREYPELKTINHDAALVSVFINRRLVTSDIEKWYALSLNKEDEISLIIPIAGG